MLGIFSMFKIAVVTTEKFGVQLIQFYLAPDGFKLSAFP